MEKQELVKEEKESEKLKDMNNNKKIALPYLDDNIKQDIFSRVPADLLLKTFKLLSKQWNNIISTPSFIEAQTLHSRRGFLQKVYTEDGDFQLRFLDLEGKGDNNKVKILCNFPKKLENFHSCNGLILCEYSYSDVFDIVNPVTKEILTLPRCNYWGSIWTDLGFVSSTKKYKVVELCQAIKNHRHFLRIRTLGVNGFTDEARIVLEELQWIFYSGGEYERVLVNGEILYMPVCDTAGKGNTGKEKLLYCDVGNETILLLEFPLTIRRRRTPPLLDMGGFLSAVYISWSGHFITYDFWILKDASKEDWVMQNRIKRCILPRVATMTDAYAFRVIGSLNNGETIVFENHREGKIFTYHVETRQWKRIIISVGQEVTARLRFSKGCHLNSLVSPHNLV